MSDTPALASRSKKMPVPDHLVYEIMEGRPVYYAGYRAVLLKTKNPEEIMGSSALQALLAMALADFVRAQLGPGYLRLSNELGFILPNNSRLSLDLAVYDKSKLPDLDFLTQDRYVRIPPDLVFEIDTKADVETLESPQSYYYRKTDLLLAGGVNKVVWLFTDVRKVLVAEKGKPWLLANWSENVDILPGVVLNVDQLLAEAI